MKYLQKFFESINTSRFDEWIETDVQEMIDGMDKSCGNANIVISFHKVTPTEMAEFDIWPYAPNSDEILKANKQGGWYLVFWFEDYEPSQPYTSPIWKPINLTKNQCDIISEIVNYMADHGYPNYVIVEGEDQSDGDSSIVDNLQQLYDLEYEIGLFGAINFYSRP